ncbi:MAG: hypothetical protein HKN82_16060 [Akkermansiaceae bacterium]|nr:hypothetical protein [Akkermansiaceae bacterium]
MRRAGLPPVLLAALAAVAAAPASLATPAENLATYAKGVFAELEGDLAGARGHFETALAAAPDSYQVARKTADSQLDDDDLAAASRTLRTFARTHPAHLPSHLNYADFLDLHARNDAVAMQVATELLEGANQRFAHTPSVYSRLINLHENAGRRERSLEIFRSQFEAPGAGPDHWMALAPIAKTLLPGDSEELATRLDTIAAKTVETGIAIPMAARAVADHYRKSDRLEKAIEVLEAHVAAAPGSLEMRTRLGLLQLYAKREGEGERTLLDTIAIDADQVLAHRSLAQFYARKDDLAKSLHHRAEILRIAGGDPHEFLDLANTYLENGEPHPARLLLEKARFEHPDDPAIAARLAVATLRDGDTTGAARLFRQAEALAKDSKDPEAARYLDADFQLEFAGSLREAGDLAAAEERLRLAARSVPDDEHAKAARTLRELARLWLDQDKNRGPATALLRRAESLDPGHPETEALLQRAKKK